MSGVSAAASPPIQLSGRTTLRGNPFPNLGQDLGKRPADPTTGPPLVKRDAPTSESTTTTTTKNPLTGLCASQLNALNQCQENPPAADHGCLSQSRAAYSCCSLHERGNLVISGPTIAECAANGFATASSSSSITTGAITTPMNTDPPVTGAISTIPGDCPSATAAANACLLSSASAADCAMEVHQAVVACHTTTVAPLTDPTSSSSSSTTTRATIGSTRTPGNNHNPPTDPTVVTSPSSPTTVRPGTIPPAPPPPPPLTSSATPNPPTVKPTTAAPVSMGVISSLANEIAEKAFATAGIQAAGALVEGAFASYFGKDSLISGAANSATQMGLSAALYGSTPELAATVVVGFSSFIATKLCDALGVEKKVFRYMINGAMTGTLSGLATLGLASSSFALSVAGVLGMSSALSGSVINTLKEMVLDKIEARRRATAAITLAENPQNPGDFMINVVNPAFAPLPQLNYPENAWGEADHRLPTYAEVERNDRALPPVELALRAQQALLAAQQARIAQQALEGLQA